jgi:hypothetical protein
MLLLLHLRIPCRRVGTSYLFLSRFIYSFFVHLAHSLSCHEWTQNRTQLVVRSIVQRAFPPLCNNVFCCYPTGNHLMHHVLHVSTSLYSSYRIQFHMHSDCFSKERLHIDRSSTVMPKHAGHWISTLRKKRSHVIKKHVLVSVMVNKGYIRGGAGQLPVSTPLCAQRTQALAAASTSNCLHETKHSTKVS